MSKTKNDYKREHIAAIAQKLKAWGYRVFIAKDGTYGFYTDGTRVVSFGGYYIGMVDFSGNYNGGANARSVGTGWQIAKELSDITEAQAKEFITAYAPRWATQGRAVTYTTPEQHLKTYGKSSGYVEV